MKIGGGGNLGSAPAFTLAEVLVTLGIIGVVSAITVPSLMQNYQRKSYVTQLHKVYNEFQQAALQYQTDRNAVNLKEAGFATQDAAANFVKTYFKVVQDCGHDVSPCFPVSVYKKLDGTTYPFSGPQDNINTFVLASGASVAVDSVSNDNSFIVLSMMVDVNGKQGPNVVGRDFFGMYLYQNGVIDDYSVLDGDPSGSNSQTEVVPAPLDKETREDNFQRACNSSRPTWGHGCFGKILNDNWEMTY